MTPAPDPLSSTSERFAAAAASPGRALLAYRRLFRDGIVDRGLVRPPAPVVRELREQTPEGPLIKFAQRIGDPGAPLARGQLETESVLIPMLGRLGRVNYTLCLSSQVGCAMGCAFCETAQMGLLRSLTPAEIVGQWFAARHVIGVEPRNIVFMGMGEPMDNLDAVIAAIAILTDHNGPGIAMSRIVVSTVGHVDGIRRLGARIRAPGWHRLNLAVSINAPGDEVRSRIMPISRRWSMADLRGALLEWPIYSGAKVCLEYVLIPGVNNLPGHAEQLAGWAAGLPACINIIPYNPRRRSPWRAPEEAEVVEFLARLVGAGAYCKRRRTKGRLLMGACGQLGNPRVRQRRLVEASISA